VSRLSRHCGILPIAERTVLHVTATRNKARESVLLAGLAGWMLDAVMMTQLSQTALRAHVPAAAADALHLYTPRASAASTTPDPRFAMQILA
jgi:hypothetical protein